MDSTLAWAWLSSPASSSEAVSSSKRRGCYGWWRREAPEQVRLLWGQEGRGPLVARTTHIIQTPSLIWQLWVHISLLPAMEDMAFLHVCESQSSAVLE